jgi:hypothetical protein
VGRSTEVTWLIDGLVATREPAWPAARRQARLSLRRRESLGGTAARPREHLDALSLVSRTLAKLNAR